MHLKLRYFRALRQCRLWNRRPNRHSYGRIIKLVVIGIGVLGFLFLISGFFFVLNFPHQSSINGQSDNNTEIDLSHNYFPSREELESRGLLVDTPKCRIPAVDYGHPQLHRKVQPPAEINCAEKMLHITFVEKQTVVINGAALKSIGYAIDDIACCYRTVDRVFQSRQAFDKNVDNLFRLSDDCVPMGKITKPRSSVIQVTCKPRGFSLRSFFYTYTNFHMVALFPENKKTAISRKLKWWQNCLSEDSSGAGTEPWNNLCSQFRENGLPPNVLLLAWDSNSRGNFHRFLPKTRKVLQDILGAVEMLGYNAVGDNALPSFVSRTTSLSVEELQLSCFRNWSQPLDNCPFIWKEFSNHHYLTGYLEDAPGVTSFKNLKMGLVKSPPDIYVRPSMLTESGDNSASFPDCIGYQRPEEVILNYIIDLVELSEIHQIPFMITSWLTELTHQHPSQLRITDDLLASTLTRLNNNGLLENTVLILMSTHGHRDEEVHGWLEERLPTLWIALPPSLEEQQSSWQQALQDNSKVLTTPFDVYELLQDILNLSSPIKKKSIRRKSRGNQGISPFKKIPARSCQEANIPAEYCTCAPPTSCEFNSTVIELAAETALKSISSSLPPGCANLQVATILACGAIENNLDSEFNEGNEVEISAAETDVVIAFKTNPGSFLIEAGVRYNKTVEKFTSVNWYKRRNKHVMSSECLSVPENGWIELFCYCDTTGNWVTAV